MSEYRNHEEFDDFDVNAIYHILNEYTKCLKSVPGRPDYIKIRGQELEISKEALRQLCYEAVDHTAVILTIIQHKKIVNQNQCNKIELTDVRHANITANGSQDSD